MNTMHYSKYNSERNPLFQTSTHIFSSDTRTVVVKKALSELSRQHIQNFAVNAGLLQGCNSTACVPSVEMPDSSTVQYDYVDGRSLDSNLKDAYQKGDRNGFDELLNRYRFLLLSFGTEASNPSTRSAFADIFGVWNANGPVECLRISNIDLTFDNIIIDHEGIYHIIDFEWVFKFPVPVDYIVWRSLTHFFDRQTFVSTTITLDRCLELQKIPAERFSAFRRMEAAFLKYVYRSRKDLYVTNTFKKNQYSKEAYLIKEQDLSRKLTVRKVKQYLKLFFRGSNSFFENRFLANVSAWMQAWENRAGGAASTILRPSIFTKKSS